MTRIHFMYPNDTMLKLLVEKLARSDRKFITADELKAYCKTLKGDYLVAVKYLIRNKYVARVFKGIFYVYSLRERKLGASDMSFHDILKEALRLKGVTNWYFGLETALKYNNLTHESFTIDVVMNDTIFRARPMTIMGRKVKFHKLIPSLLTFGLRGIAIKYSDPERTALDMRYLKHYGAEEFHEATKAMSEDKLRHYVKRYPAKLQHQVNP